MTRHTKTRVRCGWDKLEVSISLRDRAEDSGAENLF